MTKYVLIFLLYITSSTLLKSEDHIYVNYYDLSANRDYYNEKDVSLFGVLDGVWGEGVYNGTPTSYFLCFNMEQAQFDLSTFGYRIYFTDRFNKKELDKYIGHYVLIRGFYKKPKNNREDAGSMIDVDFITILNYDKKLK